MNLTVGDKIVYPSQGPCLVGSIVKRIIDGKTMTFYQLVILDDQGGDLFIPLDKVETIGIRLLLDKADIPALLDHLTKPADPGVDWKNRTSKNTKLFASGSAFDLAEIVASLTEWKETKALSFGECKRLERAKSLLACEISQVTEATKEEAEEQIEKFLMARSGSFKPAPINESDLAAASNRKMERKETAARRNRKAQQAIAQGT